MTKDIILGLVRHLLTAGGALLSANGLGTSAEMESGVGAIIVLAGLAWSMFDKRNRT